MSKKQSLHYTDNVYYKTNVVDVTYPLFCCFIHNRWHFLSKPAGMLAILEINSDSRSRLCQVLYEWCIAALKLSMDMLIIMQGDAPK